MLSGVETGFRDDGLTFVKDDASCLPAASLVGQMYVNGVAGRGGLPLLHNEVKILIAKHLIEAHAKTNCVGAIRGSRRQFIAQRVCDAPAFRVHSLIMMIQGVRATGR